MDLTMLLRQPPEVVAAMVVMEVVEVMVELVVVVVVVVIVVVVVAAVGGLERVTLYQGQSCGALLCVPSSHGSYRPWRRPAIQMGVPWLVGIWWKRAGSRPQEPPPPHSTTSPPVGRGSV